MTGDVITVQAVDVLIVQLEFAITIFGVFSNADDIISSSGALTFNSKTQEVSAQIKGPLALPRPLARQRWWEIVLLGCVKTSFAANILVLVWRNCQSLGQTAAP